MLKSFLKAGAVLLVVSVLAVSAGCGGGGGSSASSSVQGVATPSSVSVVTAN